MYTHAGFEGQRPRELPIMQLPIMLFGLEESQPRTIIPVECTNKKPDGVDGGNAKSCSGGITPAR